MRRIYLWILIPGIFVTLGGLLGWIAGKTSVNYVLLGVIFIINGLYYRNRQKKLD